MDGLHNVSAAPDTILIDGKEYHSKPLGLVELGELERHVVTLRTNPLKELAGQLQHFSLDERKQLIKAGVEVLAERPKMGTMQEVQDYAGTPAGMAHTFFLIVRDAHPEVDSPKAAGEILDKIDEAGTAALMQRLKDLSAADELGKNSEGSTQQITEIDPHESRGLGSIAS